MKNFVILGVAGYVAPRHLKAISELGHNLIAAMDPNDSVGILDRYFPKCQFFTSEENLENFITAYIETGRSIDYVVICSPNYLHRKHIELGIRLGASVICEKPLVIDSKDMPILEKLIAQSGKDISTILQLRLHPQIKAIQSFLKASTHTRHKVELTYVTGRGPWYHESWKGDINKSGGIVCNIGIHLFDMLLWIFGPVANSETHVFNNTMASGLLELEQADVSWFLSIDGSFADNGLDSRISRSLIIDGTAFDFTSGFENLHTLSYDMIINKNKGYSICDVKSSIKLIETITNDDVIGPQIHGHKYAQ